MKIFGQSNLTVSEGDIASFTCLVRCMAPGIACVGLSVNWTRRGDVSDNDIQQLPDGTKISMEHANATLSFPSAIAGDMGVYVCTGSTQNFSSSVAAYLTVKGNGTSIITGIYNYLCLFELPELFFVFIGSCSCHHGYTSNSFHSTKQTSYSTLHI